MTGEQFARFDWKSKRQGTVAFDGEGHALNAPDWFPVFVSADELAAIRETRLEVFGQWTNTEPGNSLDLEIRMD